MTRSERELATTSRQFMRSYEVLEQQLDGLPDDQQEDEDDVEGGDFDYVAVVTASDWTTQTILSQLEKGNIDLNPSFQRRQAWRSTRKSQFCRIPILGIPYRSSS